jgi:hypothetical protein
MSSTHSIKNRQLTEMVFNGVRAAHSSISVNCRFLMGCVLLIRAFQLIAGF